MPLKGDKETPLDAAIRIAPHLDGGTFPVQGPPGSGKTHTGARMICTLAKFDKRIGITANSHKVIRNLLGGVLKAADELGAAIQCIEKVSEKEAALPRLQFTPDNAKLLGSVGHGCQVGAGTAWLWARPDASQVLDVLFIDEAAQMALANVIAISQSARTVVLLGDPRQLEQPLQGTHPEGTAVSALDHILGLHATIPPDRGLFLEKRGGCIRAYARTPPNCSTTAACTPGRGSTINGSIPGCSTARVCAFCPWSTRAIRAPPPEEADTILALVERLLQGATWTDRDGKNAPIGLDDILIIAPYNAQVFELQDPHPRRKDRNGRQVPGPGGPDRHLFDDNIQPCRCSAGHGVSLQPDRLNVASSRAKAICVLVRSPLLFEPECRTPRKMQLANAFCRYLEMATVI
jgi:hypothetical protein